jgi:hypothetical protein
MASAETGGEMFALLDPSARKNLSQKTAALPQSLASSAGSIRPQTTVGGAKRTHPTIVNYVERDFRIL